MERAEALAALVSPARSYWIHRSRTPSVRRHNQLSAMTKAGDHSNVLPVPFYHGTSTLFLDSILAAGLGGRNPIGEWGILEFAHQILPLVNEYVAPDRSWMVKAQSFSWMVERKSAAMNFQHGDTYLSPARSTAVRYAINKKYGSELVSYTLDFLQELLNRNVPGVRDDLFRRYPQVFDLLDVSVAPLLVQADGVDGRSIRTELGGDPAASLGELVNTFRQRPSEVETLHSQTNFRLDEALSPACLRVWLITVSRYDPIAPQYALHEIQTSRANGA